jgi:phosphoribosyl-AMP cyclohydrolase / phosphoribosyl-ATP pyrophosphohydrolase
MTWTEDLKFDERGLLPVVTQDAGTGEVLMLAYASREALRLTLDTGRAHYWSRSRAQLWQKGETSGHSQRVVEVRLDCDGDALLYRVEQRGPACHTGEPSCFHRAVDGVEGVRGAGPAHILARLEAIVQHRQAVRPEGSYTGYLFDRGVDKVLKKLGEEATEAVIAAKNADNAELTSEVADLLFHLLVLLRIRELPLAAVWAELEARFGSESRLPRQGVAAHPHS